MACTRAAALLLCTLACLQAGEARAWHRYRPLALPSLRPALPDGARRAVCAGGLPLPAGPVVAPVAQRVPGHAGCPAAPRSRGPSRRRPCPRQSPPIPTPRCRRSRVPRTRASSALTRVSWAVAGSGRAKVRRRPTPWSPVWWSARRAHAEPAVPERTAPDLARHAPVDAGSVRAPFPCRRVDRLRGDGDPWARYSRACASMSSVDRWHVGQPEFLQETLRGPRPTGTRDPTLPRAICRHTPRGGRDPVRRACAPGRRGTRRTWAPGRAGRDLRRTPRPARCPWRSHSPTPAAGRRLSGSA